LTAHAMINEVLVAFDPFNKLLKLKNVQEYCKLLYTVCNIYTNFFLVVVVAGIRVNLKVAIAPLLATLTHGL